MILPSGNSKKGSGESRPKTRTGGVDVLASSGNFEFSVRDHSDATAKRGFRVQVPRRILCYTILVFFILPIFLFVYVEMIKQSRKRQAARYHSYDQNKILPHIFHEDLLPPDDVGVIPSSFTGTEANETQVDNAQTVVEVAMEESSNVLVAGDGHTGDQEPVEKSPAEEQSKDQPTNFDDGGAPAEELMEMESTHEKNETEALVNATTSSEIEGELEPTRIRRLRASFAYA